MKKIPSLYKKKEIRNWKSAKNWKAITATAKHKNNSEKKFKNKITNLDTSIAFKCFTDKKHFLYSFHGVQNSI